MNRLRWVPRNPDAPQHCPLCGALRVAFRPGGLFPLSSGGPRTTRRCHRCGVRWKSRTRPLPLRFTERLIWRYQNQRIDPACWMRSDRGRREDWPSQGDCGDRQPGE